MAYCEAFLAEFAIMGGLYSSMNVKFVEKSIYKPIYPKSNSNHCFMKVGLIKIFPDFSERERKSHAHAIRNENECCEKIVKIIKFHENNGHKIKFQTF